MGGSSEPQTKTTTNIISPEAKELTRLAMPGYREFAQMPADAVIPPFSGVAGFDPSQTSGQEMVLGAAPGQAGVVGSAAAGTNWLTGGDVLRPESNPALRGTIDAATRPIWEQLMDTALPAVRSGAILQGGPASYGGTRQGIAEGIATRGATQAAQDASSKIATEGYKAGLDAMTKGLALAPTTAQSLSLPGLTVSGVGDVRQDETQKQLSEMISRYGVESLWPLLRSQELSGAATSLPGGGISGQQSVASAPQQNTLMQALGLGVSGLGALGAAGGSAGIAGLAPLLPFL